MPGPQRRSFFLLLFAVRPPSLPAYLVCFAVRPQSIPHPVCLLVNRNEYFARFIELKNQRNMKFLTLNEIKQQCRIEEDFTLEDTLLTAYGGASENTLLRICNRTYDDLLENFGDDDGEGGKVVPADFRVAALMLAKHLYEHRGPTENVSVSMVPYALDLLIKPFMRLTTDDENSN